MKIINIKKVFYTVDELNNSEEFKQLWSGFQMEKERNYHDLVLIKAFVADDNNIYTIREIVTGKENGLRLLSQCTVGSMLHTKPFHLGCLNGEQAIINDEKGYSRCNENRIKLAKLLRDKPDSFVTTL